MNILNKCGLYSVKQVREILGLCKTAQSQNNELIALCEKLQKDNAKAVKTCGELYEQNEGLIEFLRSLGVKYEEEESNVIKFPTEQRK